MASSKQAARRERLQDPEAAVERVRALIAEVGSKTYGEERAEVLDELIHLHDLLTEAEAEGPRHAALCFLLYVADDESILENEAYRQFIVEHVDPEEFREFEWESVEQVIQVAEVLYGFRFKEDLPPDQVTEKVRNLVRYALRQFERDGDSEKMFQLLERAPIHPAEMDEDLLRLRSRLHLYEMRNVQRKRRILYGYLIVQALLVFLLFPLLFQNFENGRIQQEIEDATGLAIVEGEIVCEQAEVGEEVECEIPRQFLTFGESLYWSVITYGSIGYGDVTPVTWQGQVMAGLHGLMGVATIAVVAGLVLNWITPRDVP
jgi:hypothetical protein